MLSGCGPVESGSRWPCNKGVSRGGGGGQRATDVQGVNGFGGGGEGGGGGKGR